MLPSSTGDGEQDLLYAYQGLKDTTTGEEWVEDHLPTSRARAVGLVTGPHACTPPHPQPVGSGPRQRAQRAGSRG